MACLTKITRMASADGPLHNSAIQKLREFKRLDYPVAVLAGVCTYMAATTSRYEWIKIREEVKGW